MEHSPPVFGAHLCDRAALAEALRIGPTDLSASAPQVVSTGAGHLLVEVGGEGCYVCSREPGDPGAAAGPLAARLVADGIVADGAEVIVEQGHAMGRPSRIEVTVTGSRVRLSGTGLVVAEGTLRT
jgi:predicted PhzF superfamily epimerase YddE/YHI9